MKLIRNDSLNIIKEKILKDEFFEEALDMIKKNSSGKIWLIGGFLYKNLVAELYGTCKKPAKDIDLIVEKANKKLILPTGWKKETNTFGNPKLFNERIEIDFIPLDKMYYIKKYKLKPCINSHLESVPLNIHYLVYDIFNNEIIGDIGIRALEKKVVSAYNLEMLKYGAKKYNTTVNDMIKEKADALGFRAELIKEFKHKRSISYKLS